MNKFMFQMMLLEKLNELVHEGIIKASGVDKVFEEIKALVNEFDNPNKVVIPWFVAEWIEENKKSTKDLKWVFNAIPDDRKVYEWMKENSMLFFRAWLDGYEVEKEKLYTVEIPDPNNGFWEHSIIERQDNGTLRIGFTDNKDWKVKDLYQLTEAEIKEDFEWAFRWVEEVE